MPDYRAVMTLLIRKRSYRQIEDQLGCSHRAISRANQALRSLGLTTAQQVAITVDRARSARERRSNSRSGKNAPWRSFGTATSIVPTRVSRSRWRYPLR